MSSTYEIVQGLAQAAANAYDGAHDERYALDGQARKVGLNREQGHPIIDKRVDFPLPLTPFKITHEEVFISRFISFKAWNSFFVFSLNTLFKFVIFIISYFLLIL